MALINDLVPFTDNLKSKEVCDLNPLGSKEIKHLKMQYHLFDRTRVSDRTPFGEIIRASDIMRWCDFARLASNHIRSHNLRKIAYICQKKC